MNVKSITRKLSNVTRTNRNFPVTTQEKLTQKIVSLPRLVLNGKHKCLHCKPMGVLNLKTKKVSVFVPVSKKAKHETSCPFFGKF